VNTSSVAIPPTLFMFYIAHSYIVCCLYLYFKYNIFIYNGDNWKPGFMAFPCFLLWFTLIILITVQTLNCYCQEVNTTELWPHSCKFESWIKLFISFSSTFLFYFNYDWYIQGYEFINVCFISSMSFNIHNLNNDIHFYLLYINCCTMHLNPLEILRDLITTDKRSMIF
jgi:hypothetical protein